MQIVKNKGVFLATPHIDLGKTLLCGQAFRWRKIDENTYEGFSEDRYLKVEQKGEGIFLHDVSDDEAAYWANYFDCQSDYTQILAQLSEDEIMRKALKASGGIRLLRQAPFEALISFIISQNNNIKRITGIVDRLCMTFGEILDDKREKYAFPTASALAGLSPDMLSPIRAGFRNRYIVDAAQKVELGEVDLNNLYQLDYASAKAELMKIVGVGEKVADCVLLFGFYKMEAFPKDVWIKRVMTQFYPDGIPACFSGYEGIAQQILFDYIRNLSE